MKPSQHRSVLYSYDTVKSAAYFIYNRGFVGRNTTPDMLPDTMSLAEKEAFLADCRARNEKSKWVLTILIPIILTFLAEMVYLFLIPQITGIFS